MLNTQETPRPHPKKGEGPISEPSTHNRMRVSGGSRGSLGGVSGEYRNGGQTDDLLCFCEEMARNIDTEGHNSQDFLQRPIGLHVYHFFWAVLSNLSASHRVSKVGYWGPDRGWGRRGWGPGGATEGREGFDKGGPGLSNSVKSQSFCTIQGAGSTIMAFFNRMESVWQADIGAAIGFEGVL